MTTAEFVDWKGLPPGSRLEIETNNRHYDIECLGGNAIRVSGHPEYCPTPVAGRVVESGFIERGQHLHLLIEGARWLTTSRVMKLRVERPKVSSSIH